MRFGLFGSAQARRSGPDTDSSQGFREFIDNNVEAEALGYYSTFLVEHHFTGFGQVSASLNLLTWLGARTRHLRLGTAVLVLPWHNPVLLAEQAATLDLLSGGRLDFGVGKGYRYNEFAGFCLPMEEADSRFESCSKSSLRPSPPRRHSRTGASTGSSTTSSSSRRPRRSRTRPSGWGRAARARCVKSLNEAIICCWVSIRWPRRSSSRSLSSEEDVEALGRTFDPMHVAVARAVHIAKNAADKEAALERRYQGHMRINALARPPGRRDQGTLQIARRRGRATRARRARSSARRTRSCVSSMRCARVGSNTSSSTSAARGKTSAVLPATSCRPSRMSRWRWQASKTVRYPSQAFNCYTWRGNDRSSEAGPVRPHRDR